jgi:Cdc6-like AAA superfamily ATPase
LARELSHEEVRRECDPRLMECDTTEELSPLDEIIGQDRAIRALRFGIDIKERGFNIYVAGVPGTGRTTTVRNFLEEVAKAKPVPNDWCYVYNFQNPYQPNPERGSRQPRRCWSCSSGTRTRRRTRREQKRAHTQP